MASSTSQLCCARSLKVYELCKAFHSITMFCDMFNESHTVCVSFHSHLSRTDHWNNYSGVKWKSERLDHKEIHETWKDEKADKVEFLAEEITSCMRELDECQSNREHFWKCFLKVSREQQKSRERRKRQSMKESIRRELCTEQDTVYKEEGRDKLLRDLSDFYPEAKSKPSIQSKWKEMKEDRQAEHSVEQNVNPPSGGRAVLSS